VARRPAHRFSVFSQSLDRAAFLAYFLGAVVPLVALTVVVDRYVLPAASDGSWSAALIAVVASISVLSAAAFLLLRRVLHASLERIQIDNERLAALLETSGKLANAPHETEVTRCAVSCAQRLAGARAAFLLGVTPDAPPKLLATSGESALFESIAEPLREAVQEAATAGQPLLVGARPGARASDLSLAAVPVDGVGALAVVTGSDRPLETSDLGSLSTLAVLASVAGRRAQLADAQRNFFVHVTDLLVAALDTHLDLQAGHSRRVAEISNRIGRELGLPEEKRQRLHFAALLHDVGMLRVPPERMADPKAHRQHPTLGHRMLAPIQLWADVAPLVLHHHEFFDGRGYPDGIAGEEIPIESRIIGLAEAFDSMTSASSYKSPVVHDEAVRRIEEASGTQFDPAVVAVFRALAQRGEV
jgi:HD-GYP domain-containing protein (c-di-GMP phosphodiesterase class II)